VARNHFLTSIWHSPAVTNLRHAASPNRLLRYVGARNRRLPDYIIAGAQKSGTTSLWAYLCEHPNVDPPIEKEVNFFDRNYDRGMNWYRMHFPTGRAGDSSEAASARAITGEATPNYMFQQRALERIAEALPGVKVILLLRNPVDRAFSHYQLKLKRRQETRSFEEAIDAETERLETDHERIIADPDYYARMHDRYTYLARGLYADQIARCRRFFRPERLLILESGKFFKDTAQVFERVCDFLALPRWQPREFGNRYPGRYRERMGDATRRRLVAYFAPHNARLYAQLGTRFDWDR
jgi:Sulfotransferase domain